MKEFLADKLNLCMMHTHLSTAYVLFLYIQDRAKHSCRSVSLRLLDLMAVASCTITPDSYGTILLVGG